MVAPQKLGTLGAGKRSDGATEIRQMVRALNKVYEVTITSGVNTHSFFNDFGYNAVQGTLVNDGKGAVKFSFTRDGTIYGEEYTVRPGEKFDLNGLDVHSIRITFISISADYRIWQI